MFFWIFGFYTSWMLGIACLAYQKLKGFDDYATHFVGRKDYGVFVMMLTSLRLPPVSKTKAIKHS